VEQGQLPAETRAHSITVVQQFVDAADSSAHQAKAAAELELKGVNRKPAQLKLP